MFRIKSDDITFIHQFIHRHWEKNGNDFIFYGFIKREALMTQQTRFYWKYSRFKYTRCRSSIHQKKKMGKFPHHHHRKFEDVYVSRLSSTEWSEKIIIKKMWHRARGRVIEMRSKYVHNKYRSNDSKCIIHKRHTLWFIATRKSAWLGLFPNRAFKFTTTVACLFTFTPLPTIAAASHRFRISLLLRRHTKIWLLWKIFPFFL